MPYQSIGKNYIYTLLYQLSAFAIPLITTPYIARVLGADGIGISSYTHSITTYFILAAALGTTEYAQREIAYRQDIFEQRTIMFWEIFLLRCISGFLSLIIFIAVTKSSEYKFFFAIQGINILSVVFDISWFFQGMEDFGRIALRNIMVRLLNIFPIFLFVKDREDLPFYIASLALTTLAGHISVWIHLPQYLKHIKSSKIHPLRNLPRIFHFFIPSIAIQVSAVLDKTMLGMFSASIFESGYYEQADRIEKLCLTMVSALGVIMLSRISYLFSKNDLTYLKLHIYRSYRFIGMTAIPMTFGLLIIADTFVPLFFGTGYEKTVILIQILSVLLIIVGLSNVTGMQYLIPTGQQKQFTKSVIVGCLVNLVLNFILIPRFLSIGAAIATVIGEIVVTLSQLTMTRKIFSVKKILEDSLNYVISSCGMSVLILLIKTKIECDFGGIITLISIGVLSYIVGLYLLKDKLLIQIFEKFTI